MVSLRKGSTEVEPYIYPHQANSAYLGLKLSFNEKKASYENLHRALLTGLLSFIANKTDERNVFMAVRQQKARIFPASTLHKTNTPWVMAFEMVETSQVYIRTLAKIEPEWIFQIHLFLQM